jgi:hypothetical protein
MKSQIICFLTVRPNELFYNFCLKLKNEKTDIYICIDDDNHNIPNYNDEIPIIKIERSICEASGFKSTVHTNDPLNSFNNKAVSRDKALYYFCKNDIDYEHIWFIEEDVFIPTEQTIENLNIMYPEGDLLCRDNIIVYEKQYGDSQWEWPHWSHVNSQIQIEPPYSRSMVCAIRCSKNIMNVIHDYASKYNNLFMDEVLFTTLALHNNFPIVCPHELSSILWTNEWNKWDITSSNNLYHPIKDIITQYEFRL